MRYELKKISLWAFVKVFFFVNMVLGFLIGLLYAMFFGFFLAVMQNLPYMPNEGFEAPSDAPLGFIVVIIPFIFALIGGFIYTVLGMLFVIIYNLVAKVTGGIEINLESFVEMTPVAQPAYAQTQKPEYSVPPPPPPVAEDYQPPPAPPSTSTDDTPPKDDNEFPSRTVGG